ncbi:PQQ-binding-like beta-propeller repeat protein [Rubrivirga sp.]|uniref:outer membrane protein assembly factor BamB family protein n=1 Tax=Rubrivirga sp. TaxID=1885344 RepID=UPI003C71A9E8
MRTLALLLAFGLAGCSSIQLGNPLGERDATPPSLPITEAWERDVQAAFGPSPATVTQRYVVVGTRRGEVVVLDRETGSTAGVGEFGDSVEGAIATSESGAVLYVSTAEQNGSVYALDVDSGRRLWRWRGGASVAGVVRTGSVLVVPLLQSKVVALEAASGAVLWDLDLWAGGSGGAQYHAAPVALEVEGGPAVLIASDDGGVAALRAVDGEPLWSYGAGAPIYATPTVAEGAVVVTTTRGAVVVLEAETGRARWRVQTDGVLRASPAAVSDGLVVVGFTDGTVRAFDLEDGAERWRYRTDGNVTATPVAVDDQIAVGTMDRRLVLLDRETGVETWSTELRGRVKSALGVGGGLLIALVEPRHVVAFQSVP